MMRMTATLRVLLTLPLLAAPAPPVANRPPSIVLIAPANNSEVQPGGEIRVEAVVHNAHPRSVTFLFKGRPTVTIKEPPYKTAIRIPDNGVLVARAEIPGRSIVSNKVFITVITPDLLSRPELTTIPPNDKPYLHATITSPPYGSVYRAPAVIHVVVDAYSEDAIENMKLAANGAVVATLDHAPFEFDWRCNYPNEYRLTVFTRDKHGQVHQSAPVLAVVR